MKRKTRLNPRKANVKPMVKARFSSCASPKPSFFLAFFDVKNQGVRCLFSGGPRKVLRKLPSFSRLQTHGHYTIAVYLKKQPQRQGRPLNMFWYQWRCFTGFGSASRFSLVAKLEDLETKVNQIHKAKTTAKLQSNNKTYITTFPSKHTWLFHLLSMTFPAVLPGARGHGIGGFDLQGEVRLGRFE